MNPARFFGVQPLNIEPDRLPIGIERLSSFHTVTLDRVSEFLGIDDSVALILGDEYFVAVMALYNNHNPLVGHAGEIGPEAGIPVFSTVISAARALQLIDKCLGKSFESELEAHPSSVMDYSSIESSSETSALGS